MLCLLVVWGRADAAEGDAERDPQRVLQAFREGMAAFDAGRWEQAHSHLTVVRAVRPDHPKLLLVVGISAYNLRRYQEAEDCFAIAVRHGLDSARLRLYRGLALWHLHRFDEAVRQHDLILEQQADSPQAERVRLWRETIAALEAERRATMRSDDDAAAKADVPRLPRTDGGGIAPMVYARARAFYDSNPNRLAEDELESEAEDGDGGGDGLAMVQIRDSASPGLGVSVLVWGRFYREQSQLDSTLIQGECFARIVTGAETWSPALRAHRTWSDGDALEDMVSGECVWSHRFSSTWSGGLKGLGYLRRYAQDRYQALDGEGYGLFGEVGYRPRLAGCRADYRVELGWERHVAEDAIYSRDDIGIDLASRTPISDAHALRVKLHFLDRRYDQAAWWQDEARHDRQWGATVSWEWRPHVRWIVGLDVTYEDRYSTEARYDFDHYKSALGVAWFYAGR